MASTWERQAAHLLGLRMEASSLPAIGMDVQNPTLPHCNNWTLVGVPHPAQSIPGETLLTFNFLWKLHMAWKGTLKHRQDNKYSNWGALKLLSVKAKMINTVISPFFLIAPSNGKRYFKNKYLQLHHNPNAIALLVKLTKINTSLNQITRNKGSRLTSKLFSFVYLAKWVSVQP